MSLIFIFIVIVFVSLLFIVIRYKKISISYLGNAEFTTQSVVPIIFIDNATTQPYISYTFNGVETKYFTGSNKYLPPSSNQQVKQIVKYGTNIDKGRLVALLLRKNNNLRAFNKYIYMNDSDTYKQISPKYKSDPVQRGKHHALSVYKSLARINTLSKNPVYLDYGCGDGYFSDELAKLLNASSTHCIDVELLENRNKNVDYKIIKIDDKVLPYDDNTFDVVTAMMSLHHVKDIQEICSEIIRILKPDGLLYIKEHDCWTAMDAMLIDIEHGIYMENKDDYGHVLQYRNYYSWDKLFTGLKYIKGVYYNHLGSTEGAASRSYWTIYAKPIQQN